MSAADDLVAIAVCGIVGFSAFFAGMNTEESNIRKSCVKAEKVVIDSMVFECKFKEPVK